MNNIWIRTIFGGILLLAFQILVLNGLDIDAHIHPQIYILLLLSLPVNLPHWLSMFIAFGVGYFVDWFSDTQGLHAATLTMLAYIRYGYLKAAIDKDQYLEGMRPVYGNVENVWYLVYVSIFSFIFHFVLFILEDFSFSHFGDTLLTILYSSSLAILLILLIQFTFNTRVTND
jgi:rod shape-determining protein MreD